MYSFVLLMMGGEGSSISSKIAASRIIGLEIPDSVFTVLCS
jgi:hypothetical protein